MNDRRQAFLKSWEQALGRLSEVLLRDSSDRIVIDAAIQRFEFCFELGWKTLKVFLEFEGYAPPTPRQTLKDPLRIQWLSGPPRSNVRTVWFFESILLNLNFIERDVF